LWDAAKAVLRGKFIAISTHDRKLERSQINNLLIYLKLLENKSKTTQKVIERDYKNQGRNQ
jgi:hypothetical protein